MSGLNTILAFVIGFMGAQILKTIIVFSSSKKKITFKSFIEVLMRSGGMPSGHSAGFAALTTYIGFSCGIDSIYFALAFCMALIVIYDACNVRYAVGEQGKVLNALVKAVKLEDKRLKIVEGHTVLQVLAGIVFGVLVGIFTFLIF